MPKSWLSHLIAGGGKESGKMGRKAPGPEAGSGSPVSWLLLSSVHTDGPYSYVWPGWAEHHAATYSEIRDAAALTSLGKPLLCVFRNHTRDGLVHFMNVKIIYSIFVYIFILQIIILNKTIMILSESYITMKDIAFLPSCVNDDCTQKQKTAWPEFWVHIYNEQMLFFKLCISQFSQQYCTMDGCRILAVPPTDDYLCDNRYLWMLLNFIICSCKYDVNYTDLSCCQYPIKSKVSWVSLFLFSFTMLIYIVHTM